MYKVYIKLTVQDLQRIGDINLTTIAATASSHLMKRRRPQPNTFMIPRPKNKF